MEGPIAYKDIVYGSYLLVLADVEVEHCAWNQPRHWTRQTTD